MTTTTPTTTDPNDRSHAPILVIGAGGKTGRRVATLLETSGHTVRGASRSTEPAFDWYDESSWPAALTGASAAYLTFQPDLALPGAPEIITAFTAAAERHGVQRLVLLSGRGEPIAQTCEQIIHDSPIDASVVRCALFAQNFSEFFLLEPVLHGVIALPAGDVAEPIVDADDIADVVVSCLTEDRHAGRTYELTGPRLLTFHEMASELSAATGRPITYRPVTSAEYVTGAVEAGMADEEARLMGDLFTEIFDGRNASVTSGVTEALGRPARDFGAYAAATAATGVWNRPVAAHV